MIKEESSEEEDERKKYFEEIAKYRKIKEDARNYNMAQRLMASSAINALQFGRKPNFTVEEIKENKKGIIEKEPHQYHWINDNAEQKKLRKAKKEFAEEIRKKEKFEQIIREQNKMLEETIKKYTKIKREEEEREQEAKKEELKQNQKQFSEKICKNHKEEELKEQEEKNNQERKRKGQDPIEIFEKKTLKIQKKDRKEFLGRVRNDYKMKLQKEKEEEKEQKDKKRKEFEKKQEEEKKIQEGNKENMRFLRKKFSYTYYLPTTQQKNSIQQCCDYIDQVEDFKERNLPHTNLQIFKMGLKEPSYHYKLTLEERMELKKREHEEKMRQQRQRIRSKYYYWSRIGNELQKKVVKQCIELIDRGAKEKQLPYTPLKIFKLGLEPRLDRMYPDIPLYNLLAKMPEEKKYIEEDYIT
jgi:hypothetical protein